jgi:ABC-type nitrate/sulfonate/bicarbonate transport system permease component
VAAMTNECGRAGSTSSLVAGLGNIGSYDIAAQSQTPLAFAAIILLTLISILLFYAIEMLEKRFVTRTP